MRMTVASWNQVILVLCSIIHTLAQETHPQTVTVTTTSTVTALSSCTSTKTLTRSLTQSDPLTTSNNIGASTAYGSTTEGDLTTASFEPTGAVTSVTSTGSVRQETDTTSLPPTLSICPTRIINPTYTTSFPLPTDYTWGCPPRYLCQPNQKTESGNCNFEAGPPADGYYCSPDECVPSPPLLPPQYWGPPGLSTEIGHFEVSPGYFNLNPLEFGLDYSIFTFPAQSENAARDLSLRIPGQCYDECNDAMLEAESCGKTTELCRANSAFLTLVRSCQSCVASANVVRSSTTTLPQFQQFLFFCNSTLDQTIPAHSSTLSSTSMKTTASPSLQTTTFTVETDSSTVSNSSITTATTNSGSPSTRATSSGSPLPGSAAIGATPSGLATTGTAGSNSGLGRATSSSFMPSDSSRGGDTHTTALAETETASASSRTISKGFTSTSTSVPLTPILASCGSLTGNLSPLHLISLFMVLVLT